MKRLAAVALHLYALYTSHVPITVRAAVQRAARLAGSAALAYLVARGLSSSPSTWGPAVGLLPAAVEVAWRRFVTSPEEKALVDWLTAEAAKTASKAVTPSA